MTMITPSYLGETIEYSSLHACRSTLEDPTNLCTSHSREETYAPPLIRPSGTFSHREKALTIPSLSHRERVARSAG